MLKVDILSLQVNHILKSIVRTRYDIIVLFRGRFRYLWLGADVILALQVLDTTGRGRELSFGHLLLSKSFSQIDIVTT